MTPSVTVPGDANLSEAIVTITAVCIHLCVDTCRWMRQTRLATRTEQTNRSPEKM